MIGMAPLPDAIVSASAMALAGLVAGLAYFRGLRLAVDLFARGRGWILPLGLTLARLAGLIAVLLLSVRFGAAALIACFLGFLLARTIAVRLAGEMR
jgi:F1F0 ATPase subunit 2